MPFKKIHPYLKEKLVALEIDVPTPIQKASIPVIKSGANVYCNAAVASGKTTTLILTTLHKLKCEATGNAPRAIVLVENNEKVLALNEAFLKFTKYSDFRLYACDEKQHIELLKNEIFEGVDVLIATPKTLKKLILLEGVNTTQLKIFNIDDATFLENKIAYADVMSVTESISKCQFVLYSEKKSATIKRFESYFMQFAKTVSI